MKAFLVALFLATSASAETLIIPVQDLLFEVPQFKESPRMNLNAALNGAWTPESPRKSKRAERKKIESQLLDLVWEMYPDAQSVRIWRGTLIIKLP
jgi:hypothetical protein